MTCTITAITREIEGLATKDIATVTKEYQQYLATITTKQVETRQQYEKALAAAAAQKEVAIISHNLCEQALAACRTPHADLAPIEDVLAEGGDTLQLFLIRSMPLTISFQFKHVEAFRLLLEHIGYAQYFYELIGQANRNGLLEALCLGIIPTPEERELCAIATARLL